MKKIIKTTIALIILSGIFYSCDKENAVMDLKGETLTYDAFFEKVVASDIKIDKDHVLYFDYTWNKKTNLITVNNIIEREPSFFVLEKSTASSKSTNAKASKGAYTVECTKGGKTTSTTCDGKFSCGSAIADCLDKGGCATICKNVLVYVPPVQTFYLLEDGTEIESY